MNYARHYIKGLTRLLQAILNRKIECVLLLLLLAAGTFFLKKALDNPYKLRIVCQELKCDIYVLGIAYAKKHASFQASTQPLFDTRLARTMPKKVSNELWVFIPPQDKVKLLRAESTSIARKLKTISSKMNRWIKNSSRVRANKDVRVEILLQPRIWLNLGLLFFLAWITSSLWIILQESGKLMDRTRNVVTKKNKRRYR